MNEDETFIRAIVDGPGDDLPRLVYADWLDDRADPRGPYLRAEVEWARTGKKVKPLRALGAGLDPVWVARVSRSPVGVCSDHLGIAKNRIRAQAQDVIELERQVNLTVPIEYRAFLLNYNGGRAKLNSCPHPIFPDTNCALQPFRSLKLAKKDRKSQSLAQLIQEYQTARQRSYHTLIPLCAADAGYYEHIAIGCEKHNRGKVYHVLSFNLFDFPSRPRKLANTLGDFLATIR